MAETVAMSMLYSSFGGFLPEARSAPLYSSCRKTTVNMKFQLEDLTVYFPYEYIYPEQYQYMLELKRSLDAKGHACLEMPTGTGKTITLLSLITSYQLARPETGKLIYCTRTVPEMEKVLAELKVLQAYRESIVGPDSQILALGLSSRKNMCVHPTVVDEGSRESVDSKCRQLTATWVREKAMEGQDQELCSFYEEYEKKGAEAMLPPGVYTLHDLRVYGRQKGWCPYFLARHMLAFCNVLVYNYQYLLDPKVSGLVSRELERECVVVFDEAHNIDNVCIEALSVNLRMQTLDNATRNLGRLNTAVNKLKESDQQRLNTEYRRLVEGLADQGVLQRPNGHGEDYLANPVVPDDILQEAVPGNIRRSEHFLAFMRRFVDYLKSRFTAQQVESETPVNFLAGLASNAAMDSKPLKFCYDRLTSLLKTLEIVDTEDISGLQLVADFATLVGTYSKGFQIIFEPFDERMPSIPDPVMQLTCLDASLAIQPVLARFQSVIITSGTLSPIDLYPKLLNFHPVCIQLMSHKLIFIETQDVVETSLALDNFRRACNCGRGAIFFSVARGKVAEGIDFDRHFGRCVVMFGVPYQYTLSRILRARLEYLRETFQISENDFLAFDAVRQAAQCVGRVIRSKADYGMMIFADKRYNRNDKRNKLPGWINSNLKEAHLNLSTDMALHITREFMREMAQPVDPQHAQQGLLNQESVDAMAAQGAPSGMDLDLLPPAIA
ncbi:hypothetical protein CYMTET_9690 [Cymbomonas tetramitiformis]|uniref:DNA 5'-3' helicase n=1 Tax=Cymbomonas tetramitiformis TaxID=36881 RepID=A0AAE0GR64_9CHLO|nr:hypothetical protein CYMTET_9690 [Cymbomonas tetramitiformis]